jgi:hypothetical protein
MLSCFSLLAQYSIAATGLTLSAILKEATDLDRGNGGILRFRLVRKSFHEEYIGKHFEVKPAAFFSAWRAFSAQGFTSRPAV